MAKALKVGVLDLGAELGAHAFVLGGAFHTSGAVAAGHFQALADGFDNFFVGVFLDFHLFDLPRLIFLRDWLY